MGDRSLRRRAALHLGQELVAPHELPDAPTRARSGRECDPSARSPRSPAPTAAGAAPRPPPAAALPLSTPARERPHVSMPRPLDRPRLSAGSRRPAAAGARLSRAIGASAASICEREIQRARCMTMESFAPGRVYLASATPVSSPPLARTVARSSKVPSWGPSTARSRTLTPPTPASRGRTSAPQAPRGYVRDPRRRWRRCRRTTSGDGGSGSSGGGSHREQCPAHRSHRSTVPPGRRRSGRHRPEARGPAHLLQPLEAAPD